MYRTNKIEEIKDNIKDFVSDVVDETKIGSDEIVHGDMVIKTIPYVSGNNNHTIKFNINEYIEEPASEDEIYKAINEMEYFEVDNGIFTYKCEIYDWDFNKETGELEINFIVYDVEVE